MEEKELKTSKKQRIIISIIALVMVGSFIASYAAIILNASSDNSSASAASLSDERLAELSQEYGDAVEAFKDATQSNFGTFKPYLSEIKAFNETSANASGVQSRDLLTGSGRVLADGDYDYLAYYVGWCADGKIFDSALDNESSPSAFVKAIDAKTSNMIEGWYVGTLDMRVGSVREITIASDLAYKEQNIGCGNYSPLKFLVMAVDRTDPILSSTTAVENATMRLQYAAYGIDPDTLTAN